ncbi:MAG: glutamate racemase [Treponema sp.]|nr:glutamate racemase [Treponema sp.]MDY3759287.1 glutamate racemase [Treponema sp.]MDY5837286.1 glutamate racemase [Treponema sp.]
MKKSVDFAFLDSGTGGIPYMLLLKEKSPERRCVYLGDTVHFPYGEKSFEEIVSCSSHAISQIIDRWNPRAVIIACNTISVTALDELRKLYPGLPIIGTVPAIKLAAKVSLNKKIGFLATNASVNHPYSQKLIEDFASDCQVLKRGDPDLIDFIEHRLFTATREEKMAAVMPAVDYFNSCGCDTIILGCTHFTHMAREIDEAFASKSWRKVFVVDSRDGVSNHALDVIKTAPEKPDSENLPEDMTFFVTSLNGDDEKKEYEILCDKFHIPFGGCIC